MHRDPCTWLRLPESFTKELAERVPMGLWLQPDGCCNGPSWVVTAFTPSGFILLMRGWKSFAVARGLKEGHILHFKYDGAATLFMKIFGVIGYRLKCCTESDDSDSPGNNDGDMYPFDGSGSSDDSPSVKSEDEDSD
ncbi:B3 domain-containing protein Os03g0212300-like [Aegilops tauschii subsp. strangulata]|uniref:B3 domain-containing protein Os03g0212300-like n=1 Tax=Aegilops tauschii subsp. strangulata TaxID=200361 RepID=UPI00098A9FA0|nr:B3 domain-containing protein Os03g0212300-like [Aegilops tauschii subsp. strangulata]